MDNRINNMFDNDINRVVERARRNGTPILGWQVVDTRNGWGITIVDDPTPYERGNNNGQYLFTPVFDPEVTDCNGNPIH